MNDVLIETVWQLVVLIVGSLILFAVWPEQPPAWFVHLVK